MATNTINKRIGYRCVFTIGCLAMLSGTHAVAEVIHVPDDYTTIQEAIDAAIDGEAVIVDDGEYTGDGNRDLDFLGKAIIVRSENGPANCIINCEGTEEDPHRGFYFHSGETAVAVVEGFTTRNGCVTNDSPDGAKGGGICIQGSSPTIRDCVIENSSAIGLGQGQGFGGGVMSMNEASPTFENCIIQNNLARNKTYPEIGGGGMMCAQGGSVMLINCDIVGNAAAADVGIEAYDGGIGCQFGTHLDLINCTITDNTATVKGGIGIEQPGATATIVDCVIANNTAELAAGGMGCNSGAGPATLINCMFLNNAGGEWYGGGLVCRYGDVTLTNCMFVGNATEGKGGGMFVQLNGIADVANCIFWDNSAPEGAQIGGDSYSEITVSYSDVLGSEEGVYCASCTLNWKSGNIDADPLFVDDEAGDYHLSAGSPCIDAGNNWCVPVDASDYDEDGKTCELFPVDLDGNPRFTDDLEVDDTGCGTPAVVDMGAYEYPGDAAEIVYADTDGSGTVDVLDLLDVLGDWGECDGCLSDIDINGKVNVLDLLELLAAWGSCP